MPLYEFGCSACGIHRDALLKYEEMQAIRNGGPLACPECKEQTYKEVWTKAPMGRIGGSGSERDIKAMQQSFQQRFAKSGEMDDIRHKHGTAFDDSIRGAAVERIKDAGAT